MKDRITIAVARRLMHLVQEFEAKERIETLRGEDATYHRVTKEQLQHAYNKVTNTTYYATA